MNDIEKKIEELKSEFLTKLETLQKEVKMQQGEQKLWKPEIGESYFFIRSDFGVMDKVKGTTSFETDCISNGNCFRTKERAEQVAEKMRLLLRLEQLHDMLCPDYEPDWSNEDEHKFYLFYDGKSSNWKYTYWSNFDFRVGEYFDTEENAKKSSGNSEQGTGGVRMKNPALQRKNLYNKDEVEHSHKMAIYQGIAMVFVTLEWNYGWKQKRLNRLFENLQSIAEIPPIFGKAPDALEQIQHFKQDYQIDFTKVQLQVRGKAEQ